MLKKGFSVIRFKASGEGEERVIEGMASTPTVDRVGDIVDPMGAEYAEEIPLHLYHDSTLPVGRVRFGRATKKGIPFKAFLPTVLEAGTVRDRVDEAWHSLKYQLISAVSIGFRVLKDEGKYAIEYLEEGGLKFLKTEIMELSLVSIPANPDAVITGIKSLDDELRGAMSGQKLTHRVVRLGVNTPASVLAQEKSIKGSSMKVRESMQGFAAKRATLLASLKAIMETAEKEGRSLTKEETEQYEQHEAEIDEIDKHLVRLQSFERLEAKAALPVKIEEDDDEPEVTGTKARQPHVVAVERQEKLAPGVAFARYAMCLGAAKGNIPLALEVAKNRFPQMKPLQAILKAAVAAGTTSDATWAGPLLEYNQYAGDFLEFLRPQTILGKFGQGGVPSLRRVPFNINIRGQTSGGTGYWVGQGKPKPLTKFDFNNTYLAWTKVAAIAVLTEELVRFSNPNAEVLVRDALAAALIELLDETFIDPTVSEVANVSPASITNGISDPIEASGTDADAVRVDVKALMGKFIAANISLSSGVFIMPNTVALALSLMTNALGQAEFPGITMNGGTFMGLPVIASEYLDSPSDGQYIVLASAQDIWLADDDVITLDASREASLQMLDNPTNASDNGTATAMVSMFQTDSIALRAERFVHWKKRRSEAVQMINGVEYGTGT